MVMSHCNIDKKHWLILQCDVTNQPNGANWLNKMVPPINQRECQVDQTMGTLCQWEKMLIGVT